MAAADHEIGPGADLFQHRRQDALVVLQIGVHHRDDRGAGGQHALDAGARETAPVDAAQAAHARILARDFLGERRRAVGAVVVHDDHFPGDSGQSSVHPPHQFAQVAAFVEGGDDEGEFDGQGRKFPFVRQIC